MFLRHESGVRRWLIGNYAIKMSSLVNSSSAIGCCSVAVPAEVVNHEIGCKRRTHVLPSPPIHRGIRLSSPLMRHSLYTRARLFKIIILRLSQRSQRVSARYFQVQVHVISFDRNKCCIDKICVYLFHRILRLSLRKMNDGEDEIKRRIHEIFKGILEDTKFKLFAH